MNHDLICQAPRCPHPGCPYQNQSELDHAWATIPAECRGADAADRPAPGRAAGHTDPLERVADIVTFVLTAVFVIAIAAVILAWFLDIKPWW